MKREEIIKRLGFQAGDSKKKRVIVVSDVNTEADDPYAIVHHLLSPAEDVRGIIACNYEEKYSRSEYFKDQKGTSMMQCFEEGKKILDLMEIEDIPVRKGSQYPLTREELMPESEGADFIVREALRETNSPLYIASMGAVTDIAIALKKAPEIADKLTVVLIGGQSYPGGGPEPNLCRDITAARILFASPVPVWQVPQEVYCTVEISLAEVVDKVKPCGKVGAYLYDEMKAVNDFYAQVPCPMAWPHGESWSLGDNPTVAVLLQSQNRQCWHMEKAPLLADDGSYKDNPEGKWIRVYDAIDGRLCMEDFFSKLRLCYGMG